MLQKIIITALALGALLSGSVAFAQTSSSTPPFKPLPVIFPIAELGGCASQDACKTYCDVTANQDACFAYAQTHGLMTADAIQKARDFLKSHMASSLSGQATPPKLPPPPPRAASSTIDELLATVVGPGGCTTQDACKIYCDNPANSDECLQFAQDHHLMSTTSIALAKKLEAQVGPGGCQGEACKTYCNDSTHEQVCVAFAQQNGFISNDDANARMLQMKISSTTRPMPPIPVGGDGRVGSTTLPRPDVGPGIHGEPPRPPEGTSTGQSSSIFFAVLHFFGL